MNNIRFLRITHSTKFFLAFLLAILVINPSLSNTENKLSFKYYYPFLPHNKFFLPPPIGNPNVYISSKYIILEYHPDDIGTSAHLQFFDQSTGGYFGQVYLINHSGKISGEGVFRVLRSTVPLSTPNSYTFHYENIDQQGNIYGGFSYHLTF